MKERFGLRAQLYIAWILLALIMLAYALAMSYQTMERYNTFKATAFDLGNMDQVVWNTLHGHWFAFTNQGIDWYGPPIRLAQHFEPILVPLSLLYLIFADPRTLLVFQTLVLVTGAVPIFILTRRYLREWPLIAPVMVGAYLLSPSLLGINLFDFHPISLATPLLLYAVLAITYHRTGWFVLCCVLAAACKEDLPLTVALLGVMVIWKFKQPRLGIIFIIGGIIWSGLAFFVIMPRFYPGTLHNNFWYRYEALGSSPAAAVVNILLHPWVLLNYVTLDRIYYLGSLIRSVGFLPLLAPEWLLPTLPSLALNMLSSDNNLYGGVYHYNAAIIPFVMLAAIHGTRRLITLWQLWRGEKQQGLQEQLFVVQGANGRVSGDVLVHQRIRLERVGAKLMLLLSPALAFSQTVISGPVFTRSVARVQPGFVALRQVGDTQWRRFSERMGDLARYVPVPRLQWFIYLWILAMLTLNFVIMTPALNAFWATGMAPSREQHIQQLIHMIPPDAAVSASDNLNPHVSERLYVTIFPSITYATVNNVNSTVDYIIVDLNAVQGTFPEDRVDVTHELNQLIRSKQFCTLRQAEGVILLKRCST